MKPDNQHYSTEYPDVNLKVHTLSESLRRHLYIFKTTTGVFSYKKLDLGTKILIEHMTIPQNPGVFLDLGCGYGAIGIVLGYESPKSQIVFVDINRRAIWSTKENIKINLPNSQERITILTGNYFDPIKPKNLTFDGIYMNPPLREGRKKFLELSAEIPNFLKPNGSFEFVIRKKMGAPYILNYFKNFFEQDKFQISIKIKRSGYWVFNLRLS